MIKLIKNNFFETFFQLPESHNKNKILSLYEAYNTSADFCVFYEVTENQKSSMLCAFGNSLIFADNKLEDYSELAAFSSGFDDVSLSEECAVKLMKHIGERFRYQPLDVNVYCGKLYEKVDFDDSPEIRNVYDIVSSGFDNIKFDFWYVDMSHRIRHGISKVFTYQNSSTATVQFDIENKVFLSQIATLPEHRGKGGAQTLLRQIASRYTEEGKEVYLFAKPKLREFYNKVGFETKSSFAQLIKK